MSRRGRVGLQPGLRVRLCASRPLSPRAGQLLEWLEAGPHRMVAGEDAADIVIWTGDAARDVPLPVGDALSVLDGHGLRPETDELSDWRGVGLILAPSEAAYGAWTGRTAGWSRRPGIAVVPFAGQGAAGRGEGGVSDRFDALLLLGGSSPSAATRTMLARAAAWAAAKGVPCGVIDAVGAAGLATMARGGAAPLRPAPGALLFDARAEPVLDVPDGAVAALLGGAPMLCCTATPLLRALERAGAGGAAAEPEMALDAYAALSADRRRAMSQAACAFARARWNPAESSDSLHRALDAAAANLRRERERWLQPQPGAEPGGHVLVVSDEALNLVDVRVHLPFDALLRRGVIAGYTVLRHGEFSWSSRPVTPELRFDHIWVHRSVDLGVQLMLQVLGRKFVYDVDDNLLVSPSYRTKFPPETIDVARGLLRGAEVLSCATVPLFRSLARHSNEPLLGKSIITPNLAHGAPRPPVAGPPRTVVWASSDKPALTGSRAEVERAVRDFCLAHDLPLVCVGAEPPPVLARSKVRIEHIGLLSYAGYLHRLQACAPGILVGPLETDAEPETQDFVDGKSDVKVMEARLAGLVGAFSRARPYLDSDLEPPVLCDNTYESWLAGLERARALCVDPPPAEAWPARRSAALQGPMPWAEALARARLSHGLGPDELQDAVRFVREQQASLLGSREAFDEAYYLARHEDVRIAVEQGIVRSGHEHYVNSGYSEGRAARRRPTAQTASDTWWSTLLQTTSRLERDVQARGGEIERLRGRLALRRRQEARPASSAPKSIPSPVAPPAHPSMDVHWHPPGAVVDQPCPVCDTSGPHPVLLVADGETLARCRKCSSCFYNRRVGYDYEREQDADVLRQLYLEQNASIYHQTRFLFAIDDKEIDSVLDVGCGFGYPVHVASSVLGWRAVGIDPSFYAREGARLLGADIRKAYLAEDSELGAPFGLVMASEVIEHVPDPYAFLALLRRFLRKGGTLVLTTPDSAALEPGIGPGSLIGILALKVHLILFTKDSLAMALRRAGFRHVQVQSAQDNLVAYASDRPLRFHEDAAERHVQAYKRYLEHLVDTAEPGSALWNGGAGRLFSLLAGDAGLPILHAVFGRIAAAWRERFGIDLARIRLPALIAESAFIAGDPATTPAALAATQPLNLPGVLFNRAVLEYRTPGRTPEAVLAYARPAYMYAVQTRRVLQAEDMIDLDLKLTAWRARQLVIDCLAELAPEVEGELLRGLAEPSPGALHDRVDPPADAITARIAPWFSRTVQADRFDEARRLLPWMEDFDLLCTATEAEPERLFRGLFTVGVMRLIADGDPAAALEAFERMAIEARARIDDPRHGPLAREFLRVAEEHVRLAGDRLQVAA